MVEVDGPVHEQQAGYDAERDQVLSSLGLRVLRVTNEQIARDLASVLKRITEATQDT